MRLSWPLVLGAGLRLPRSVAHRVGLIRDNAAFRRERVAWLSELTRASQETVEACVEEIERDDPFLRDVRSAYRRHTVYLPLPTDFMVARNGSTLFFHCVSLYVFVRLVRPGVIVETGGTPGKSSAFILRALERNGAGHLYTIDLPPPECRGAIRPGEAPARRPAGAEANWCVPAYLRDRQTLLLGPAEQELPWLLAQLSEICLFIHDSDHSDRHMRWELECAYPFVRPGGGLWADDIFSSEAWSGFVGEHDLLCHDFLSQGVACKAGGTAGEWRVRSGGPA